MRNKRILALLVALISLLTLLPAASAASDVYGSEGTFLAYVPLRSATERERAAFLIPCQGLRDYFTNFQFTRFRSASRWGLRHVLSGTYSSC